MRHHIHFTHGRGIHRQHVQQALHFSHQAKRPSFVVSGGAVKKNEGGSIRQHIGKKLTPLKFKL